MFVTPTPISDAGDRETDALRTVPVSELRSALLQEFEAPTTHVRSFSMDAFISRGRVFAAMPFGAAEKRSAGEAIVEYYRMERALDLLEIRSDYALDLGTRVDPWETLVVPLLRQLRPSAERPRFHLASTNPSRPRGSIASSATSTRVIAKRATRMTIIAVRTSATYWSPKPSPPRIGLPSQSATEAPSGRVMM
jgi:hypothetical protein